MPPYVRRPYSSYKNRFKKSKSTNLPVKRAITKYRTSTGKKPVAQKLANNRNALMTLASQVRNLQGGGGGERGTGGLGRRAEMKICDRGDGDGGDGGGDGGLGGGSAGSPLGRIPAHGRSAGGRR